MERERFSGFSPLHVDAIADLLDTKAIDYEVFVDEQAETGPVCFDVVTSDVERLLADEECRRSGFKRPDEFDAEELAASEEFPASEDFLCVHCDHHQFEAGLCPVHAEALLPFDAWNEARKNHATRGTRTLMYAVLAAIMLFVAWHFAR